MRKQLKEKLNEALSHWSFHTLNAIFEKKKFKIQQDSYCAPNEKILVFSEKSATTIIFQAPEADLRKVAQYLKIEIEPDSVVQVEEQRRIQ